MTTALTPEQLATYSRTMRRRAAEGVERRERRRKAAWALAQEAAGLLRDRYGATTVIAFGSLAEGTHFSERSDIDLAAAGLRLGDHYAALGRLLTLSPDFQFDLVDLDTCAAELRAAILARGASL